MNQPRPLRPHAVDAHTNGEACKQAPLQAFDAWMAAGPVPPGGGWTRAPWTGGMIVHTSAKALGLESGTRTWKGPFDPASDPLWQAMQAMQAMQADQLSERDDWMARSREVDRLLGEGGDRMETFVPRARGADAEVVIRPEAVAAIDATTVAGKRGATLSSEVDLFYGADCRCRRRRAGGVFRCAATRPLVCTGLGTVGALAVHTGVFIVTTP